MVYPHRAIKGDEDRVQPLSRWLLVPIVVCIEYPCFSPYIPVHNYSLGKLPVPALIRNQDARRFFLHLQGLTVDPAARIDAAGIYSLIEHLGFVQIDSINTVERAHHQILFSRHQTYTHDHLQQLLEKSGELFENWTHDASIIPSCFYPYWRHRFERSRPVLRERWRKWRRDGFEELFDDVRNHIHHQGPTLSRDLTLATPRQGSGDGWWDWHPAKTALEYLWRTGEIAVVRRQGFQKVYDLADRVIPASHYETEISAKAFVDWSCASALDRLGFATPREIAAFWEGITLDEVKAWVANQGDRLVAVEVETAIGQEPRPCLAWHDYKTRMGDINDAPSRLRVLSPFDPLLRDRERAERLFGFRYRIEVFVPAAKRQYGYYVFPLLEGSKMVGRIDMKADRKTNVLKVTAVWLEQGIRASAGRVSKIQAEMERIRKFSGMETISWQNGWMRA